MSRVSASAADFAATPVLLAADREVARRVELARLAARFLAVVRFFCVFRFGLAALAVASGLGAACALLPVCGESGFAGVSNSASGVS